MKTIEIRVRPQDGLQKAIDSLPVSDERAVIRLAAGTYREKIVLARPCTELVGDGADSTVITWSDGAFEPMEDGMKRGTFRTASLRTDGRGITLRSLTVENAAGPGSTAGQAIALYADGDGFLCEDCVLRGSQDTLFTAPLPPKEVEKNGFIGPKQYAPRVPQRHTYRRCRIEGDVDFIFGGAAAWFEECDIVSTDKRAVKDAPYSSFCTAASTPRGQAFGYVFHRCRFIGDGVPDRSVYLGRPWRDYARTVLIGCELRSHIRPEGWDDWGKAERLGEAVFAEYACFGPGAAGTRAPFARALTPDEAAGITYGAFLTSLQATGQAGPGMV